MGCSGGESYRDWWLNWYLPRMPNFVAQDVARTVRFLENPLGLGMDAYEHWRGIPLPRKYGMGIDFFVQLAKDWPRKDLTYPQRFGRAVINSLEGTGVSMVSTAGGAKVGGAAFTMSLPIDSVKLFL